MIDVTSLRMPRMPSPVPPPQSPANGVGPPLIATITMNPSIDIAAQAQSVRPTHKLRTFAERQDAGGGGINVSRVIHALGGRSMALVLAGASTGRQLEELLDESGLVRQTVPIAGRTRTSYNVTDASTGHEYRFIGPGPMVTEPEWRAMLDAVMSLDAGWLIASGSLPPGVPEDFYARVARAAASRSINFVLDASGPALRVGLAAGVELVKSSLTELESVAGCKLPSAAAQNAAALEIVRSGRARLMALTLGENGARTGLGVRRAASAGARCRGERHGRRRRQLPCRDGDGASGRTRPGGRVCLGDCRRRRRGDGSGHCSAGTHHRGTPARADPGSTRYRVIRRRPARPSRRRAGP